MAYTDRKKVPKYKGHTYGNFAQSAAYRDDQMEYYGLDRIDNGEGITGRGGYDVEAEEKAILQAMNNDYDLRESVKYGKNSGDKRFKDFESTGFKDLHEASLGQRAAQKYGMNVLGEEVVGNKVQKREDYAAVSDALFQKDRSKYGEDFATKDDMSALQEQQAKAVTQQDEPFQPSEELVQAKERVQAWEQGDQNPGSAYGSGKSSSSDAYGAALKKAQQGGSVETDVDSFSQKVADVRTIQKVLRTLLMTLKRMSRLELTLNPFYKLVV